MLMRGFHDARKPTFQTHREEYKFIKVIQYQFAIEFRTYNAFGIIFWYIYKSRICIILQKYLIESYTKNINIKFM